MFKHKGNAAAMPLFYYNTHCTIWRLKVLLLLSECVFEQSVSPFSLIINQLLSIIAGCKKGANSSCVPLS